MTVNRTISNFSPRRQPVTHFTRRFVSVAKMANGVGLIPGPFRAPPNEAGVLRWSAAVSISRRGNRRKSEFVNWERSWNLPDDAILGKSLDGIITSWNKGAERIYGYRENEVIGQPTSILVSADRPKEELHEILGRIARGEVVDHYETVRRKKDGQEIHLSLTVSPIRNREGKIIGASSVAHDITSSKEIEKELRESEERFRELAENINEVFYISDPKKAHSIYVSPAYEKIWGRTCESLYASRGRGRMRFIPRIKSG